MKFYAKLLLVVIVAIIILGLIPIFMKEVCFTIAQTEVSTLRSRY